MGNFDLRKSGGLCLLWTVVLQVKVQFEGFGVAMFVVGRVVCSVDVMFSDVGLLMVCVEVIPRPS